MSCYGGNKANYYNAETWSVAKKEMSSRISINDDKDKYKKFVK